MALLPGDDGPYVFGSILPVAANGSRLLDFLASAYGYQPREVWEGRVRDGSVSLDGLVTTDPSHLLKQGMAMSYRHGHYEEPVVPTDWDVVEQGEDWMAVAKPAGQPVHSTARIFRQTLVWQVRKVHGEGWSPCHRLDRDTSGLVLMARTKPALSWLQSAFEKRRVRKEYLACLSGTLTESVLLEGAIGPEEGSAIRSRLCVVPADHPSGKESRTEFVPLGYDPVRGGTWCRVHPHQGRRHQIRVHAQHLGHPLVGDPLYDGKGGLGYLARLSGQSEEEVCRISGAMRLWLHSCSLEFLDPAPSGLPQRVVAPSPIGAPAFA